MDHIALSVFVYKTLVLLTGSFFCYLGYKLFKLGLFEKAGDLKATWGDKNLIIKQASPGTFFVLLGAIIVTVSILKQSSIVKDTKETFNNGTLSQLSPDEEYDFLPALTPSNDSMMAELIQFEKEISQKRDSVRKVIAFKRRNEILIRATRVTTNARQDVKDDK